MHKSAWIFFCFIVLLNGCSSFSKAKNIRQTFPQNIANYVLLKKPEFIAQKDSDCGPASLAMLFSNYQSHWDIKKITQQVYSPKHEGSFPQDMISSMRRHKYLSMPVRSHRNILNSINNNHPVIVLQNLGTHKLPMWHYSLVVGYDLYKNVYFIHSATNPYSEISMGRFDYTWVLADNWAYSIRKPNSIDKDLNLGDYVKEIEANKNLNHQESYDYYKSLSEAFPESIHPVVGMAHSAAQMENWRKSLVHYEHALKMDSEHKKEIRKSLQWVAAKAKEVN